MCDDIRTVWQKKDVVKGINMNNIVILCFKIDGSPQRRILNMSEECDVRVGHCQ